MYGAEQCLERVGCTRDRLGPWDMSRHDTTRHDTMDGGRRSAVKEQRSAGMWESKETCCYCSCYLLLPCGRAPSSASRSDEMGVSYEAREFDISTQDSAAWILIRSRGSNHVDGFLWPRYFAMRCDAMRCEARGQPGHGPLLLLHHSAVPCGAGGWREDGWIQVSLIAVDYQNTHQRSRP